jgi:ATP-dependent RNA helicase RhlE
MKFSDLSLIEPIQKAVAEEGYENPSPIQEQSIPHLIEGRDLLGCAQTGTGKTAAFALPILQRLDGGDVRNRKIRALVMTPTRELAAQIDESFKTYGKNLSLRTTVVFGGVGQAPQEKSIRRGTDILVATPGRLLDLMNQGIISLRQLEVFVLDEADRMLDMGFIHDVRKVIKELPPKRQSLFFSATMPPEVSKLARTLLTDPVKVEITPQSTPVERIEQSVRFVDRGNKRKLLEDLLRDKSIFKTLVFTRTKHRASRIARQLAQRKIPADSIHGDKSQSARIRALEGFRSGRLRVLVATDIAARGIDVDGITHVINYELPNEPESYVHRIGRTARAGADGVAISLCSGDELEYLKDIEYTIGRKVEVVTDHPHHSDEAANGFVDGAPAEKPKKRRRPKEQQDGQRSPRGRSQRGGQRGRSSGGSGEARGEGGGGPKRRRRRRSGSSPSSSSSSSAGNSSSRPSGNREGQGKKKASQSFDHGIFG